MKSELRGELRSGTAHSFRWWIISSLHSLEICIWSNKICAEGLETDLKGVLKLMLSSGVFQKPILELDLEGAAVFGNCWDVFWELLQLWELQGGPEGAVEAVRAQLGGIWGAESCRKEPRKLQEGNWKCGGWEGKSGGKIWGQRGSGGAGGAVRERNVGAQVGAAGQHWGQQDNIGDNRTTLGAPGQHWGL